MIYYTWKKARFWGFYFLFYATCFNFILFLLSRYINGFLYYFVIVMLFITAGDNIALNKSILCLHAKCEFVYNKIVLIYILIKEHIKLPGLFLTETR